ncbi:protein HipA [Escherichia coli]|uniref:Protein HipA n=1 Tax=Escherichia coli TaxID=562 RepID=A0A376U9C1_ECOLX|nr:protein HipA [Escherichia coli]
MIREENDFRILGCWREEKTALLRIGNDWCIPKGITPTTHIIKLPIGEIRQPNATLDLSQSVDNEYYCLLLAKELGLNVPDAEIIKAGRVRALAVERFDRRWNTERTVLLRLPQEDMCQTFGLPSSVKYESDGGPGIARIMAFLMGSSEALRDRYDFMKFQVFQWLIGATDGHAKNFSVFIQAGGSYRLTPFYDIISAFPVLGGTGIHISDLKLAMGLNASKGKKTAIDKIYPRHFLATAKVLRFPEVQMHEILSDFARMIPAALDNVKTSLPTDFPENVVTAVETNVLRLHGRLSENTVVSEIWGLVVVNEHDNHDRQRLDSSLVYTGAHNVYYVKSCLSDAKCFSGSRYSFRVQELKPLLFHNWPVPWRNSLVIPCPMLRAQCLSHRHCIRKHQRVLLLI